jgi:hypothetical protein
MIRKYCKFQIFRNDSKFIYEEIKNTLNPRNVYHHSVQDSFFRLMSKTKY